MSSDEALQQGTSPSDTGISDSKLTKKALCDYVVNVVEGCRHGCTFCYVPSMPSIWADPGDKFAEAGIEQPAADWGDYALYREKVVQNVADDLHRSTRGWESTNRGQGVVGISFSTDCYMDPKAGELTLGVVKALVGHDRSARLLTRNPVLAEAMHGDVYRALPDESVTIGASIPSLDEDEVAAIETDAPPIEQRFRGLEALDEVPTFVSMSPTYPTQDREDLRTLLETIHDRVAPEVVFHEPINPRSGNFEKCIAAAREAGQTTLANELERITNESEWRLYALRQLRDVQELADEIGQPVHLWPDDDLLENAPTEEQKEWCRAWRHRPSPEAIGNGPACREPYPDAPAIATHSQGDISAYAEVRDA